MLLEDMVGKSPNSDWIAILSENGNSIIIYDQYNTKEKEIIPLKNWNWKLPHNVKIRKSKKILLKSLVKKCNANHHITLQKNAAEKVSTLLTTPKASPQIILEYFQKEKIGLKLVVIEKTPISPETFKLLIQDIKIHMENKEIKINAIYKLEDNKIKFQNGITKNINQIELQNLIEFSAQYKL